MFGGLSDFFSQLLNLFQWWIVIAPWEQAIRVRRGRKINALKPGVHFRIPGFDRFFVQPTRKRFMNTPTQTVTTRDKQAVTVSGGTAYSIADLGLLYNTLSDAENVIQIETMALIAEFIATHDMADITPTDIQRHINAYLDLSRYGLAGVEFLITDFVNVKTYRIINTTPKDWWAGSTLNTQSERTVGRGGNIVAG